MGRSERLRSTLAPNLPTSSAVERTLGWAISLSEKSIPPRLVAFLAEKPEQSGVVKSLLDSCAAGTKRADDLLATGCHGASWLENTSSVRTMLAGAEATAESLASARVAASECGAKSACALGELHNAAKSVCSYLRLQIQAAEWTEALGADPFAFDDPGEAVRQTIFWVESLHSDRIPAGVIAWLVAEHSDSRMHWWSSLVRDAKAWRRLRTTQRQTALPEFDDSTKLAGWRSGLSERRSSLSLAIEQLARVVARTDVPLAKIRRASEQLRASSESSIRAEGLRLAIPGSAGIQTAESAAEIRGYAKWIAGRPVEVAAWARESSAAVACAHFSALKPMLEEEMLTWGRLSELMDSFGSLDADGPSGMLSEEQSIAQALAATEGAISNLHGLSSWAALQRETSRTTEMGIDRIAHVVIQKRGTPEQAVAAFDAGVAWQKALVVWKENPGLETFRSSTHEDTRAHFAREDATAVSQRNRERILFALRAGSQGGMASWGNGSSDQLLIHEGGKRRKLLPVRKLVEHAGSRMQELCPCWLATPSAISQFMPPGAAILAHLPRKTIGRDPERRCFLAAQLAEPEEMIACEANGGGERGPSSRRQRDLSPFLAVDR